VQVYYFIISPLTSSVSLLKVYVELSFPYGEAEGSLQNFSVPLFPFSGSFTNVLNKTSSNPSLWEAYCLICLHVAISF
jgi:hypothetical protein